MRKQRPTTRFKVKRLGSPDANDQVRHAVANVTLEGFKLSSEAIKLAKDVATGAVSTQEAVNKLCGQYARQA
ncbi:MAG: antitoxin VbhA family protein [Sedimenticola sp.]